VTIDVLLDGEGSFATVGEAFPAIDSDERWWLPFNCVLVRHGDNTLLIDTGIGPAPRAFVPESEARLLEELARHDVTPDDVDLVVHTHLHVDHVGWDGAFPNARYVVHEQDWDFFMSNESLAERPHLREKVLPLKDVLFGARRDAGDAGRKPAAVAGSHARPHVRASRLDACPRRRRRA
jgi:glyoxylase-like metal-dependent hydrolase (beta-lactamase superfamily II)